MRGELAADALRFRDEFAVHSPPLAKRLCDMNLEDFSLMAYFLLMAAVYVPSRTGKSLLLHDGYTYYLKNLQAHGRKQWYCSSRDMAGCRADVITAPARRPADGDVLFLVRGRHIHAPPSYYFTPDGKYVRRKDVYHRYR
ncbi:FLYWCH zinc finger domain-containing protein [Phthorimaea operculella]|nr:FLYWCH zinc finger domain-containing protein [Phthorimaea operculella]